LCGGRATSAAAAAIAAAAATAAAAADAAVAAAADGTSPPPLIHCATAVDNDADAADDVHAAADDVNDVAADDIIGDAAHYGGLVPLLRLRQGQVDFSKSKRYEITTPGSKAVGTLVHHNTSGSGSLLHISHEAGLARGDGSAAVYLSVTNRAVGFKR